MPLSHYRTLGRSGLVANADLDGLWKEPVTSQRIQLRALEASSALDGGQSKESLNVHDNLRGCTVDGMSTAGTIGEIANQA